MRRVVSAEDYHGPVLFSGDAAADVMDSLFIPNVEADRPEMGTTARTQGAYTSSFHARVLPDFLNATDDPLTTTFAGHALLGAYAVDDEGVPAQAVNVAVNGKLENYLIGRTPIRDFPESNGHGRAAARAGRALARGRHDLQVDCAVQRRRDERAPARDGQGPGPRCLRGGDARRSSWRRACSTWCIPTARRQLVRGAVFDELDNRSLRSDIVAAGDDEYVANSLGAVPTTTIAPSLLFDDIGVKRATEEQQKLPYYGPPALERPLRARTSSESIAASSAEPDTAARQGRECGCCPQSGSRSPCPGSSD